MVLTMSKTQNVDPESFVVYQGEYGDYYHQRATCATNPEIPSNLDAAANTLEQVEMYRVREIETNDQTLCPHCTSELRKALGIDNE